MSAKSPEPVVFVETGENRYPYPGEFYLEASTDNMMQHHGYGPSQFNRTIYRRLPSGWLAEAVERVRTAYAKHNTALTGSRLWHPASEDLIAALFPPPEEPVPEWALHTAHTLGHAGAHEEEYAHRCEKCVAWGRIIAKHAAERGNP